MNISIEWGEKKNLKTNFYKPYWQIPSFVDVPRVLLSLGKERVTKLQKTSAWEANEQASVAQRLDSAIHRINLYSVDSAISFPDTYPPNSDLSGG